MYAAHPLKTPSENVHPPAETAVTLDASHDPMLGRRLSSFLIEAKLGQGGMGLVYRALDERLHRAVALKVLPEDYASDPDRKRRFLREARAAAAVTHPNVATIYEVGEVEGRLFIAMEFVDGGTLRDRLTGGPQAVGTVLRIGIAAAQGLARAHAAGLVHRDLKPENIGLTLEGQVKLLDFGLAKRLPLDSGTPAPNFAGLPDTTVDGAIQGTPGYMAPEQSMGRPVDARTDVYALGVVLYEIATGRRPFGGRSTMEVLVAALRDTPPEPSALGVVLPAALEALIMRCLARDPDARYPDGAALFTALEAMNGPAAETRPVRLDSHASGFGATVPVTATEPTSAPVSAPPPARRRLAVGLAGAAVGIFGMVGMWFVLERPPGAPAHSERVTTGLGAADVLSCPQFAVEGLEGPSGWLGAAGAHVACRLATPWLGGETQRTRLAAELLGLPREPSSDFPDDPYVAPDARRRAIDAAKREGGRWLDGVVRVLPDGFTVRLVVRDPGETAHGESAGRGPTLHDAVIAAMDRLSADGHLPRAAALTPAVEEWGLARTPAALDALVRLTLASAAESGLEPSCAAARALQGELTRQGSAALRAACDEAEVGPRTRWTETAASGRAADLRSAEAASIPPDAPSAARAMKAALEARAHLDAGDNDRARQAARRACLDDPRNPEVWELNALASLGRNGQDVAALAYQGWMPEVVHAWTMGGWSSSPGVSTAALTERRLRSQRRSFLLAPRGRLNTISLITTLIDAGRREEVRTLAARLSGLSGQEDLAEGALALVDAAEARVGAAYARLRGLLLAAPDVGDSVGLSSLILYPALELAIALGRGPELADELIRRFVLAEPVRVSTWAATGPRATAHLCLVGSPGGRGACLARLRALTESGHFRGLYWPGAETLLAGAEHWDRGAVAAAVDAWRPYLATTDTAPILTLLLDDAGETELATRLDRVSLSRAGMSIHGLVVHTREARRAHARGDLDTARRHATVVVEAFELADVPVPAVAQMRAILAGGR